MELLAMLKEFPLPVLAIGFSILVVVSIFLLVQYCKVKGLEGIRKDVYQYILVAEHMFSESNTGKEKFQWVIRQTRLLLPRWMQLFVSEKTLKRIVQNWFIGVKDLLDDGKVNESQRE